MSGPELRLPGIVRGRGRPAGPGKPIERTPLPGLTAARKAAGDSLATAGKAIGVTQSHLSKVERGDARLDVLRAVRLAQRYGVTVESFLPAQTAARPRLETVSGIGRAHWASYLINGEPGELEPGEIEAADRFTAWLGGVPVDCSEESFFACPDGEPGGLKGDCLTYTALVPVP